MNDVTEFLLPPQEGPIADSDDDLKSNHQAKKARREKPSEYMSIYWIPATSNMCERLFSRARLVLSDYRKSMSPVTLEALLFLNCNRRLWDAQLLSKLSVGIE